MTKTHQVRAIRVGEHNPKVDHNIITGLLLTDADTVGQKLERVEKGILKGLYAFRKEIPTGEVYICNGVEFPNVEAVDFLLYLLVQLERNDWKRKLSFKSIRKLLKEVFGENSFGKTWIEVLKRSLIIWKNHSFYFPKSFVWYGNLVEAYFGVIEDFTIESQGRGKPAKIEIVFNEKFVKICKDTDWYRRPRWVEIRKLRKEVAKSLYLLAYDYRPNEESKEWKIYINSDLKYWYRNALNSLANPKYLYPKLIIEGRIKPAIKEINDKTNLQMEWLETEEGNYCIAIEEVAPPGTEKIEIPFDKLKEEDKAILIAYLEAVAEEKKIQNIWGFLRSMSSKQVDKWLKEARKYFESLSERDKETELVEKPRLLEILRDWGRKKLEGKNFLYKTYFGEDKILKAYENNKKVVFICVDRIMADLLAKMYGKELRDVFHKEVIFEEIQ